MNIIRESISSAAKKASFGMASARSGLSEPGLAELLPPPDSLNAVELPCEFLLKQDPASEALFTKFKNAYGVIHAGNIVEPELSRNIASASPALKNEFLNVTADAIRRLDALGVSAASIDMGLDNIASDPAAAKNAEKLLRSLIPLMNETDITLLLPFTVPLRGDADAAAAADFLRRVMMPRLKIRLELFPHEIKPDTLPETMAAPLFTETGSVMLIYYADSGNFIVGAHFRPWLEALSFYGSRAPFFLAPQSSGNRFLSVELEKYSKSVAEMRAENISTTEGLENA